MSRSQCGAPGHRRPPWAGRISPPRTPPPVPPDARKASHLGQHAVDAAVGNLVHVELEVPLQVLKHEAEIVLARQHVLQPGGGKIEEKRRQKKRLRWRLRRRRNRPAGNRNGDTRDGAPSPQALPDNVPVVELPQDGNLANGNAARGAAVGTSGERKVPHRQRTSTAHSLPRAACGLTSARPRLRAGGTGG